VRRLALILAVGFAVALPATNASGGGATSEKRAGSGCPDQTLCVWSKKNYEGQRVKITKTGDVSNKLAHEMNNKASSLKNRFAMPGTLYDKKNGGPGDVYGFCDLDDVPDLGSFDDQASSSVVNPSSWRARRVCRRSAESKAGEHCPDGSLCLWTDPNYEGKRLVIEKRKLSNRIYRFEGPDGPFNDAISSLKLRKSGTALLYEDTNGEGTVACFVGPHANQANLADVSFDDIASSSEIPKNPRLAC
jgi:Peptidase inhibitor family I36